MKRLLGTVAAMCVVLAACGGAPSSNAPAGGAPAAGGGGSLTAFCADEKNDNTVAAALMDIESGQISGSGPRTSAADMSTAATNAARLAGEAPQTGTGSSAQVLFQTNMNNIAQTLKNAATHLAANDSNAADYREVGVTAASTQSLSNLMTIMGTICSTGY